MRNFIRRNVKKIFFGLLSLSTVSINAMIALDAEISSLNGIALKQKTMQYKHAPVKQAHHVILAPGGMDTDTELLLKGKQEGNNAKYVAFAKLEIITLVNAWLDGEIGAGGGHKFIAGMARRNDANPGHNSTAYPADRTTAAFKVAIRKVIEDVVSAQPIIANANFSSLKATRVAISTEIATSVATWIDTLFAGGGNFLQNAPLGAAVANTPAGRSKNQFRDALRDHIVSF